MTPTESVSPPPSPPEATAARRATLGVGWRPETAGVAASRTDLGFVEVVAESLRHDAGPPPMGLSLLMDRGVEVIPHGIGLSLGGTERPTPERLAVLSSAASLVRAPLVSEHLAFVRASGREVGHLLPLPRTRAMVDLLVEHIRIAQDQLPMPLALEPVAALFEWPGAEMTEADFVAEVIERSGARLLLDLANVFVNGRNFGFDPLAYLDRVPLERLAYVHVAGGQLDRGVYHDTHAHPIWPEVLELTRELVARVPDTRVMIERDDHFGPDDDLHRELDLLATAMRHEPPPAGGALPDALRSRPMAPCDPPAAGWSDPEARDRIRATQHALVDVVVGDGAPPDGFDPEHLAVARRSIVAKRERHAARHDHEEDQLVTRRRRRRRPVRGWWG